MLALPPIDNTLVRYDAGAPEFEALVSSMLGNAGDASDGWDADLAAVMSLFAATDDAIAGLDPVMYELGTAIDAWDSLDVTSAFDDALSQVPALGSFLASLKLQTVGALAVPATPPPPPGGGSVPPPTVCVPAASSSSSSAPSGGTNTRIPPPRPFPIRTGCPDGTVWNPTTQKCEPCGPGFTFVAGDCVPNPAPSSSSSTAGTEPGPILPVPVPAPCPDGEVYDPVQGICVPIAGQAWGPGLTTIGGVVIPGSETQAATTIAQLGAAALGLPVAVIQLIPVFGQVVGAFLAFNSLFGGDWTADFNAWAAEMKVWVSTHPVVTMYDNLQQQIAAIKVNMLRRGLPAEAYVNMQRNLAELETRVAGLYKCIMAAQFTSCPGFL